METLTNDNCNLSLFSIKDNDIFSTVLGMTLAGLIYTCNDHSRPLRNEFNVISEGKFNWFSILSLSDYKQYDNSGKPINIYKLRNDSCNAI
jgi:hypothetical protein